MDNEATIRNLIKGTIRRSTRETIAAIVVIAVFARELCTQHPGTAAYLGSILIIVAAGFIMGVLWSFTLGYNLLRTHPASDSSFWREAFLAQARLLRLVPLWYLAPFSVGMLLCVAPSSPAQYPAFLASLTVVAIGFAGLTWLNRAAAFQIESQAERFTA
jgi:hypothetical protein